MEPKKTLSIENNAIIVFPIGNGKSDIPKWQIDEVRKRTENYLKNPNKTTDIDDFLKETKVKTYLNNIFYN